MEFHFPQRVHLGQGVSQKFGLAAKGVGERVLLLADAALDGTKELGIITHSLERASVPYLVVTRQPRKSLADSLTEVVDVAKASRLDVLAALGGNDQLSLGRAAVTEVAAFKKVAYLEVPTGVCYPLLLRPEAFLATGHAANLRFLPFEPPAGHTVFLDPHMATGQSSKTSVAALLEALFYGVEACLHDTTGLTEQSLLTGAIGALWSTLKKIYENPANAEYRLLAAQAGFNIAVGCALVPRGAGLTFAFTLAGLAGLSTSAFGSLLLPPLLEDFAPRGGQRLLALASAFGYTAEEGREADLGPKMAQDIRKFLSAHQLPLRLADYKLVDTQITQSADVVRGLDLRRGGILEPDQLADLIRTVL